MITNLDVMKILLNLGGSVVIACLLLVLGYRLLIRFGVPFIQSQQAIATAMGKQALCMTEITKTVQGFVVKDNSEHRELLLGLQVVGQELKTLIQAVEEIAK